ncbi:MAG: hypothetical protein H6581_27305 [Bacteroidia bacterium]|nr:hypothetical protein [Bacteroidia bacterium]
MKWWILIIAIFAAIRVQAQNGLFQIGTGITYDYGVNFTGNEHYQPLASGQTSMVSFDVFCRIPVNKFIGLYPTYFYSIPTRSMLVSNLQGDYLPNGYGFDLPYNPNNPDFWYSQDYATLTSRAEIWQQSYGSFITLMPVQGFELGTGFFMQQRRVDVYDYTAYDEYYWTGSDGTTWDHYSLWDSYQYPYSTSANSYKTRQATVPVFMNFFGQWGFFQQGMSVIYWTGADKYWSFRYTMGVAF